MNTAEQCSVVGQVAPTDRERYVNGNLMEVMIAIVVATHTPGITADDTMNTLNGVDDGCGSLTPEAPPTVVAVVEDGMA